MKKTILIVCSCAIIILLQSNFKASMKKRAILTTLNEIPVLPSQTYDYSIDPTREVIEIDDDKATLGRVLFYDKKLSSSESISCASCHDPTLSFADGKQFSEGLENLTQRNSLHLQDLAWGLPGRFSWDCEHESLQDMISIPLNDDNEIGLNMDDVATKLFNTAYYPTLFQIAFQHPVATEEKIAEALTHFIYSMTTDIRVPNSWGIDPTCTEPGSSIGIGKTLFARNCSTCHFNGSVYYFSESTNQNGLPLGDDLGAGEWDPELTGLFKLTSLSNIALTAPYMHDGRYATLEDVVRHYSDSITVSNENLVAGGFKFSKDEQKALVEFLHTLTDTAFLQNDKWADPFKTVTSTSNSEEENISVKLYPNPSTDQVTLNFDNPSGFKVDISIIDSGGLVISRHQTNDNNITLDINNLLSGIYQIHLTIANKRSTQQLIVK